MTTVNLQRGELARSLAVSRSPEPPACIGRGELFASIDVADHLIARQTCQLCPVIDWCRNEFDVAMAAALGVGSHAGPSGTWAGVLYNGRSKRVRITTSRPKGTR